MAATRARVLRLYKSLMRESQKFQSYNFKHYALRRVRDSFIESKTIKDSSEIDRLIQFGEENLEIIRRQVLIGYLYSAPELVIEKLDKQKKQ